MLPLSLKLPRPRRSLRVLLAPQQLQCLVVQGRQPLLDSAQQFSIGRIDSNSNNNSEASLAALRALLQQPVVVAAKLPLEISLSGRWSALALAPWSAALLSETSASHFLQQQLAALYGDAAHAWQVVADDAPYGQPRLVCGIERALLQAIVQLVADAGHVCRVIEPLLGAALRLLTPAPTRRISLNQLASTAPTGAVALIEADRITLAALRQRRVVALASQPASAAWRLELPLAWQRWTLRAPELAGIERVAVSDCSAPPIPAHTAALPLPPRFQLIASPFGHAGAAAVPTA